VDGCVRGPIERAYLEHFGEIAAHVLDREVYARYAQ
jgi:hypothetical protein